MIGDALLVPRHSKAGRAASSNQNWGTAYVYDGFGNLLQKNVTAGSAPSLVQSVNTATNQIDYVNYDANGNQTTLNGTPAAYDAQNRMIQYNGWNHYAYNASNQRVWRLWAQCCTSSGQQTTSEEFYVYGVNGQRVGTYTLTFAVNQNTAYASASVDDYSVYFAGRLIGHGEPYYYPNGPNAYGIQAVSTDQVGSVIDDKSLVVLGGDTYQQYYPWGEEKFGSSPNDRVKFATYRRDSESLLDYAWNRYYDNTTGRFLTPDPYKGSADPYNPQSWNRYGYVLNDPLGNVDPTGLDDADVCSDPFSAECQWWDPSGGGQGGGGGGGDYGLYWGLILVGGGVGGGGGCAAGYLTGPSGDCVPDCGQSLSAGGLLPTSVQGVALTSMLLGENSWGLIGKRQYENGDTYNDPTGPLIATGTVAEEESLMLDVVANLAVSHHTSVTQEVESGHFRGYMAGTADFASYGLSPVGSPKCGDLTLSSSEVDIFLLNGSVAYSGYNQFRAVVQGKWVRPQGTSDLRVAGTDFFVVANP